ncbi:MULTISPECIES: ThiF family adenylyltransferase [unclassified Sporosarcina]|uniref:ThiF family adenylyltransferase n=1 Tax=unclassified Sporosarcina TaxID=2647733 RepID=UPI00203EE9E2|nr:MULTISPECIES: ThiF family adenylyltransferase [unclassified Sporosarcina]GKV65162.1 thiazole biosynthesis adenylyltransferase ThiF [Sporosarcina sp. NCCP-2331]GLB55286.1 thiazole biosynthesis adenylyltransferase ThiF [Sporosarcina sp. NCCP-2378]
MENRYSRQTLFQPIGVPGQQKLSESHAVIIGCGALGSAVSETLVRAGIGKITLADRDYVESSNLQRQQLFTEADADNSVPKVVAGKQRLLSVRGDVEIHTVLDHVDGPLLEEMAAGADLLIDATDNFETRLLINDVSWKMEIPWIYGAVVGSSGSVFPFMPGRTPCFRCLLPVLPSVNETCDTVGVIAPAVQISSAHQSAEALKWLTGNEAAMRTKLLHFDVWNNTSVEAGISRIKNPDCETCGNHPVYPALHQQSGTQYAVLCGRDTVQIIPDASRELTVADGVRVAQQLQTPYRETPFFVEFHAEGYRCILFGNGRLLIHGLKNMQAGRKIYHSLFG